MDMEKSKHMKTLWSILSGSNQPSSFDIVGPFVENAKDRLISGLQHFRFRDDDSAPTVSTFSAILGHTINLKADQTAQLLESYKANEYRGTEEQFENLLKNKHFHPGLVAELWQFYHKERFYLLHCIEFLIKKALNNLHPYSNIFTGFLETYDGKGELKKSLLAQLKMLSKSNAPQTSTLVTPGLIKLWWNSNAQEIILLLQCLIHYSENHNLDAEDLLEILSTCGQLPIDCEENFHTVMHLQTALLVKVIQTKDQFPAFRLRNSAIEEQLERISNKAEYAPVLLAWMLIHYTSETDNSGSKYQQFGERAIEQRVLKIVGDIGNDQIFQGSSSLRETVCKSLADLLEVLVGSFDTERLASQTDLRVAACSLLRGSSQASDHFWIPDQGLNIVWNESIVQFPLEMTSLLEMAKAVAHSTKENKSKICLEVQELPYFMELLESVPEASLKWTTGGVVVMLQTHYPYKCTGCKEVLIPRGAIGSVDGKYIRWQVKMNLYDVALAEIQMLLQQASFGLSTVKIDTLNRVQQVLGFLELIFPQLDETFPAYARQFRQLILALIERFGTLSTATYELLANCLKCLASAITKSNASEVAGKLFSASVLPSMERQMPNGTANAVLPGVIGNVLAGVECSQGSYPLSTAFIKLTTAFIQADLADERVAVPCSLFILREILPFLLSRQYVNVEQRDLLVDLSLNWLHVLLQTDPSNQVRQMCARTLLDSPRGEAESLVSIAAFGSALAEMQLMKQTNWEDQDGHGLVMLRHIRLSLSILNVLLNDREAVGRLSPLESLLSSPSSSTGHHFTTILAHYIFYRFDLRLATLALRVLRSCANRWKNVSLLACLGHDASLIRNTWLDSLDSTLEDAGLVRTILRLMTDSVAGQPGLMHMLVNGDDRCFKAVTRLLLEANELEALELVHQFWFQRCSPAIEYFKERPKFWLQLCQPLLAAEKNPEVKRVALLFQLLAIELYNTVGKVSAELQTVLNQLPSHLTEWSDLVLNSLPSSSQPADKTGLKLLLSGWSDFLVMLAHYGPATEAGTRAKIRTDVLEALIGRAENGNNAPLLGKLAELNWMLQLVEKKNDSRMLAGLSRLLVVVAERELTSFPARFQVAVLTSAVSALRLQSGTDEELSDCMRPVSLCAQSCLIQLPQLLLGDANPNSRAIGITALCLSLLTELIPSARDLSAMQETFLLQSLISTIQFCIHHRRGWEVAETALAVLLAVARTDAGSAVLTQLQLDHSLWLPLEAVYEVQPTVYRLGLQLCTTMLGRQRHFFLEQALTLAGVHQQPITNILLKLRHPNKDDLIIAGDVMALLRQLSVFQQTWRLQHSGSMQGVLQAASSAVYFGIAHLIRTGSISPLMGTSFVEQVKDNEAVQTSPAVQELQSQLLELVSQGLALLNCYSPPLAALLTEDGIDVAKWERHLSPSFGTPSLDHLDAPPSLSFGTLNSVASHTLRILSKPDQQPDQRSRLNLVLEQSLSLLLSQALLYILDPRLCAQEKQLLKRELGAELGSFVESIRRQAQRGLRSPATASTTRPISSAVHQSFLKLLGHIVQRIFK